MAKVNILHFLGLIPDTKNGGGGLPVSHLYWKLGLTLIFFGRLFGLKTRTCTKITKSNTNVFISPEFEIWLRAAGRIFEKIVYFKLYKWKLLR